jgi:hypothetical protein
VKQPESCAAQPNCEQLLFVLTIAAFIVSLGHRMRI